ncbi:CBN-BED-3 protein [Caenorhabditis brenneri]|uniref:CBN-BED-3 protein n=1 Tax=Caenorhabditis brenneri TaxID=135651 RepID=G0PBZ0_CAEBE|nr:CBN-BED-3 protein [Caenorhabditis brenneri]
MQTQSPFGPLLGLPPALLPSPVTVAAANGHAPPVSLATFPSAFAAFASQIRSTQLQSLLQSQLQALNGDLGPPGNGPGTPLSRNNYAHHLQNHQNQQHGGKIRGTTEYPLRKRVGGSTVKTAKVWRYFDELPTVEQAAECRICRKKIKATNSSTTGMIRHLRSCHVQEYQLVQEARQNSMIVKMEEKARAKLLRDLNEKVITNGIENHPIVNVKKEPQPSESQKSPSASSSASDTASSASSSHFSTNPLIGLPAPVAIKPAVTPSSTVLNLSQSQNQCQNQNPLFKMQNIKSEATEVEEEEIEQKCPSELIHRPTDLSTKMMLISPKSTNLSSAFSSIASFEEKKNEKKIENDHKIHMQIALMLLLDQQPTHLIDRPGFRSLFKFLLPDYHLPSGDIFQATIVPQLLDHMKLQIGAIFNNSNSNSSGSIPEQVMTSSSATSSYEDNSVNESQIAGPNTADEEEELEEEIEEEENVDIEDDTSSASSSMDNETCDAMASFIHFIGNDAFPHDELISLLSVVTNIFTYFSTRPHVQTHLQMTVSHPTSQPLEQQVRFVASNLSIISDYIRHTPDMQLLPLAVNQETMLEKLVDHIDQL